MIGTWRAINVTHAERIGAESYNYYQTLYRRSGHWPNHSDKRATG